MKTKYKIIFALMALLFTISVIMIYRTKKIEAVAANEYNKLEQQFITDSDSKTENLPQREIELSELKEVNEDAVGWILIPGTDISYPVVQGDTDYYLKHTFRGEYSAAGSIFLEPENSRDMSDAHIIIYGHNMYSSGMFTELENYLDYNFWNAHQYVYVWNETGGHIYRVFSCYTAYDTNIAYSVGYEHDESFKSLADYMTESSRYETGIEVTKDDNILTLSTCYNNKNVRYIVNAVEIIKE